MASSGPIQRPSITAQASASMPSKNPSMASPRKYLGYNFSFICPFSIPPTSEAAAIRIIKNMISLGLYYLQFVYVVLFIALIPRRKVSLVYLVATKEITFLYLLLLRALPNSFVLHKIIDKRFVLFLLCIIIGVEMILTRAGIHLLITLVSTIPVILAHAVFWREDLHLVNSEDGCDANGELLPVMQNKDGGDAADESTNLV
ncbi:hypothetical protein ACH5RR_000453 [Cinchona calisaya]|uniref:PRA1 family protein n=1 Tax=Cinchona calisaya TaxID=153742 RepID=A0ABD3B1R5_9GENT